MRVLSSAASRLLATVASAIVLAACGTDVTSPVGTAIAPTTGPAAAVTGQGAGPITAEPASNMCLDVGGWRQDDGAPVILWSCHGGANQRFIWTGAGELRVYGSGDKCLDAWGGHGNDGDNLTIYTCHGGPNQKWALTPAGEIKGINGKCIDAWANGTHDGTRMVIYSCHGGRNQKWNAPSPGGAAPAPAPAPAPPSSDAAGKILGLMGAVPAAGAVESWGGPFAKYEQDFRAQAETRWGNDGTYFENANYYDRAAIFYVWYARTGNQAYLDRANTLAVAYRRDYLEARNYPLDPWWLMLDGVALHALVTGDWASRVAVGRMADRLATSGYVNDIGNINGSGENRNQARVLTAFLLANYVQAPSETGQDWAWRSRDALNKILGTQGGDGAYRFGTQCGHNKPWMVGLVNDAMIRYHTLFERDGRIVPAIRRSLDYMWAHDWRAGAQAFVYEAGNCSGSAPFTSADLNHLIVNGFGFVYRQTGDGSYRDRGEAVFAGGVYNGWLGTSKHFNQQYTSSYRYFGLR